MNNLSRHQEESSDALSPLVIYLREINTTPLLTPGEEVTLATQIGHGSMEARDQMIRANLRLVVNIARSYVGKGLGIQDLIEEGNLGLLRAVEGFDPSMGTRFSTYASYWIKQSIKRALINSSKSIRIPAYMVELLAKWRRMTQQLTEELGRAPSSEEIASRLDLSSKKLPIIQRAIYTCSLFSQSEQSENGWSLSEIAVDDRTLSPEEVILEEDNLRFMIRQLDLMDPRESAVLRLRFGIGGQAPKTLKEVGQELGLTRERVRQIETNALCRLAEALETGQSVTEEAEEDE